VAALKRIGYATVFIVHTVKAYAAVCAAYVIVPYLSFAVDVRCHWGTRYFVDTVNNSLELFFSYAIHNSSLKSTETAQSDKVKFDVGLGHVSRRRGRAALYFVNSQQTEQSDKVFLTCHGVPLRK
jgi:hypothetical protein